MNGGAFPRVSTRQGLEELYLKLVALHVAIILEGHPRFLLLPELLVKAPCINRSGIKIQ